MLVKGNKRMRETTGAVSLRDSLNDEDFDAIDGCDVDTVDETPDEELPPTEGGVA